MARKDPKRNLTRIDTGGYNGTKFSGWEVRIQRRGEQVHRFFNDRKFQGKRGALQVAQAFRDEVERITRRFSVAELAKKPSRRNKSGTVGVRKHHQVDRHGLYEYHYYYWIAQWTDGLGRRKTRSFSVDELGSKKARQMAVTARREGVKKAKR
jgi:hypothetical protein